MNRKQPGFFAFLTGAVLLLTLWSCGSSGGYNKPKNSPPMYPSATSAPSPR